MSRGKRKSVRPVAPPAPPAVPAGLPGGPPLVRPAPMTRPVRLFLPQRLAKAAEQETPISQYIRADQHVRWGLPLQPKEDR